LDTVLKTVGKIEEMLRGTFRVRRSIRTLKARPQRRSARIELPNIADTNAGMAAAMEIATQMTGAFSSTAQDLQRGCLAEIDLLNGYIARRGAELGVDVPVNHALFTLCKARGARRARERTRTFTVVFYGA